MFTYQMGSIRIESRDINSLREFVEDVINAVEPGNELPGYITDTFFSVESDYRQFHNLSEDDYSIHPELHKY